MPSYPDRFRISATADEWISARADDLAHGRAELWQLPPALLEVYSLGYAHAEHAATQRLASAELERDYLYELAYAPDASARASLQLARVERALATAERAGTLEPGAALVALMVNASAPPKAAAAPAADLEQLGADLAHGRTKLENLPAGVLDLLASILGSARARAAKGAVA